MNFSHTTGYSKVVDQIIAECDVSDDYENNIRRLRQAQRKLDMLFQKDTTEIIILLILTAIGMAVL